MESPDWLDWLGASSLTLEDCVSISLNCQPTKRQEIRETETGCSIKWEITPHCISDGVPDGPDRLYRARKYFDSHPDLLPPVLVPGKAEKRVRLIDFVRFAHALDWSMPPKLMAMLSEPSTQAIKPPRQGAQPIQLGIMKRSALVAAFKHEWPSIEADLSDASRNGLKGAAHTEMNRDWNADNARAWAKSKGKLKLESGPHGLTNVWPGAVKRHKCDK